MSVVVANEHAAHIIASDYCCLWTVSNFILDRDTEVDHKCVATSEV